MTDLRVCSGDADENMFGGDGPPCGYNIGLVSSSAVVVLSEAL